MHQASTDDPDLIAEAADYVTVLRDAVETERGPTRPRAGRALLECILAAPDLTAYVRRWAGHRRSAEGKLGALRHLPVDGIYLRLRALLIES